MPGKIDARIAELKIEMPVLGKPNPHFVPCVQTGNLLFVSGQVTMWNGVVQYVGKVGDTISLEDGQKAARLCALNIIAQARAHLGDLDRVTRFCMVQGFVNAVPGFADQAKVMNAASEVIVQIFGEAIGKHARFAIGAGSLPYNCAVEIAAVLEVR